MSVSNRTPRSSVPSNVSVLLMLAQAHELRVPEVVITGPFQGLELANQHRLQPLALGHLRLCEPFPQRPLLASGRFTEGHSLIPGP